VIQVDSHEITVTLSIKELDVWMTALRRAAKTSDVSVITWDHCPFLKQHNELVRLTGYGEREHIDLYEFLKLKSEKAR